ncbi:MAG: FecR domain-containing protein [Bacteroidota bacterium]
MDNLPNNITSELIVAFLNGKSTDEETRIIQSWIELSDENKRFVEDISTIWSESNMLNPAPIAVDADLAWGKLSSRINTTDHKTIDFSTRKSSNTINKILLRVAAVLIPAIVVSYLFFFQNKDVKQIVFATTTKTLEKQLADGSTIKLNANSKLIYPEQFKGNTREVNLQGEAFFEIAANKENPFIIHSNEANIRVVGTSFNVKSNSEYTEVFVKTGKVQLYGVDSISNDTSLVDLLPGEKGIYNFKTKKAYKQELPSENDLFWISKTLIFNKTTLSDVVETLETSYNVQIELKNTKLKDLKLSASFKQQSIENVLNIIATSLNIRVSKTNSIYEIDGEGN